ncbi:MAG: putative sulfate exporter family transporter [Pseudomonadota bacterium]
MRKHTLGVRGKLASLHANLQTHTPGVLVCITVAVTAQFLSDHYGAPAMLLALLLGIAVSFLSEDGKAVPGIKLSSRTVLRWGVALLGARVSFGLFRELGTAYIVLTVSAVMLTIGFGLLAARWFGHKWRFALLTSGSVAICGASAALAISAILPQDERSDERLLFTVVGVTVLSTAAMIVYPIIATWLTLDSSAAGVFIGGTVHDVAQVVGAGFSLSERAGETATLVKLIRVALLAPVVIVSAVLIRRCAEQPAGSDRPPLLPAFVVGFVLLAGLASFDLLPTWLVDASVTWSYWLLLTAISAVGMQTRLQQIVRVGGMAFAFIVAETAFLACVVVAGILMLGR